ncbi:MAG: cyclic nucleotide-binding domain-containing protein [Candidatus Omnitrophota bacterium]
MNGKEDVFKKFVIGYKKGDIIYRKNDEQTHFYIINAGKIHIKTDEGSPILISLAKGDFFGEESLNDKQTAAFTVEVIEDSQIIKIPYTVLADMMKKNTTIALKILKKLSEKNLKMLENAMSVVPSAESAPAKKTVKAESPAEDDESALLDPQIKAYLVIKRSNRIVQLTKKHTYLGRKDFTSGFVPDVDLTKEDEEKYISRKHSKISYHNGQFFVSEEPGAVNGTFLNGNKLSTGVKHELKNEDEITLCHLDIVFKC